MLQEGEALGRASSLVAVGDRLVVLKGPAGGSVVRSSDGSDLGGFGRGGDGFEFGYAADLQPDPGRDNSFWVFDSENHRMTRFGFEADSGRAAKALNVVALPPRPVLFAPTWLNDSTLVSVGIFQSGRIGVFDGLGRSRGVLGEEPPNPPGEQVPIEVRQHAWSGPVAAAPDGSRLVVATRHADQLEIYRSDGALLSRSRGSDSFVPLYEVKRLKGVPYMSTGEDLRFGYVDVAPGRDRFFALYSGRSREEAPGEANYGRYVQVFDWDGRLLATYELDAPVIAIAADAGAAQLFALRHRGGGALLRYSLPSAVPRASR